MIEEWRDVVGYEGLYLISSFGNIKSLHNNQVKDKGTFVTKCGYIRVELSKEGVNKKYPIHRLVAIAFLPNPENKPQVNHINGIKVCNYLTNLEWVTQSENQIHAIETKLQKSAKGNVHYNTHLTNSDIINIRNRYAYDNISQTKLAALYNITQSSIGEIIRGETWSHVGGPLTFKGSYFKKHKPTVIIPEEDRKI